MTPSDEELAAYAAAGDSRAYGVLVRRHQGAVRAFLARLTGDPALADDLAQDAMVKGFTHLSGFTGAGTVRSWLCAIAYREFLMARRKSAARARAVEGLERELHTAGPASREPDAALDLDRALAALGAEERAAVLLCYAAGMSHSQVAEAMAAPLGTVKSWIVRGRAKLKERLADHVRT